jgi:hypothetical protein
MLAAGHFGRQVTPIYCTATVGQEPEVEVAPV